MVQRYNPDYVMHAARFAPFARENEHGEFVKFSDYEALVSELARIRQINAKTLQVKLTMADTIKELTDRVNALAVENTVRGEIIERMIGIFTASGYHAVQNSHDPCSSLLFDAFQAIRQPATFATIASIEARVWAEAKDLAKSAISSDSADHIDFLFDGKIQQLREAK